MTQVSPDYYAAGVAPRTYDLVGEYFTQIPADAIGIKSYNNDDPLENIENTLSRNIYSITEKTDTTLKLQVRAAEFVPTHENYLGAIVSSNREVIYWVNESRPLPGE